MTPSDRILADHLAACKPDPLRGSDQTTSILPCEIPACERSGPVIHLTPPAEGAMGGALDMQRTKPTKKRPFYDVAPERRRGLIYDPPKKHNL